MNTNRHEAAWPGTGTVPELAAGTSRYAAETRRQGRPRYKERLAGFLGLPVPNSILRRDAE